MDENSSEIRKERLKDLEEDFNRIQSSTISFLNQTENEFESTISNFINNSLRNSIQIGFSTRETQSKANSLIHSLENLETRYRLEANSLRKEMRKLEKRIHYIESLSIPLIFQSDQYSKSIPLSNKKFSFKDEVYDSTFLPDLPKNESYMVELIENQNAQIERLLSNNDISELEAENERELQYVAQLEERNKRLQSRRDLDSDSTTMSLSSTFGNFSPIQNRTKKIINNSINNINSQKLDFSSESSFSSKDINTSKVQKNIGSLISVLDERKLRTKMDIKETKRRETKLKQFQEKQQNLYQQKMEAIEKLKQKLNSYSKYTDKAKEIQADINKSRNKLKELKNEKEQIKRKIYTAARDKHENSEALRRLKALKERVKNKALENDLKEKELRKRRKLYEDESEIVKKRGDIADAQEKKVEKLMKKISEYGIDFNNKLSESKKELEARNLAASLRKRDNKNDSLEQQLVDLLQNASGNDE